MTATTNLQKAYQILIADSSQDLEEIRFFNFRLYLVYNMDFLRKVWGE